MDSCLYKAQVMHNRLEPKKHRFHYNIFMFYINLDEIDSLVKKHWLISRNKFNLFSFRDGEHLQLPVENPDKSKSVKQHITNYLQLNDINLGKGKIMLLTNLNVFGYNFNPVSFYYCFNENEEPVCAIAEVNNTFGEMKPFLLNKEHFSANKFHWNTKKHFYVSPFIDHDVNFDFNLPIPAEKLNIRIDDYKDEKRIFISTLTGSRKQLNTSSLLAFCVRFPFVTLKIITLIHWNALKLWLKKIPYRKKAEQMNLQQGVYKKTEGYNNL